MTTDNRSSPQDEATQVERAVLEFVVELHPDHLTITELVLEMAVHRDQSEAETVRHAIRDLRGSGLLRYIGDVVVPTHVALRFASLVL